MAAGQRELGWRCRPKHWSTTTWLTRGAGNEYLRVQASAAVANANRWVVVLHTGQAATMVAASVGRFGASTMRPRVDEEYFFVQVGGGFLSPGSGTTQFILAAGLTLVTPAHPSLRPGR